MFRKIFYDIWCDIKKTKTKNYHKPNKAQSYSPTTTNQQKNPTLATTNQQNPPQINKKPNFGHKKPTKPTTNQQKTQLRPPQTCKTNPKINKNPNSSHHKPTKPTTKSTKKPHHRPPETKEGRDPRSLGHHGEPHRARERSTKMTPFQRWRKSRPFRKALLEIHAKLLVHWHRTQKRARKRKWQRGRRRGSVRRERRVGGVYWRERGYARESRRGVRGVVFGKWFTKKSGLNHFPKFYKGFSGQRKWFSVWPSFYSKTNTHKSENILLRNKQNLNEVFPS